MATNGYGALITGSREYIKQYITYDVSGRMEYVYEARANAKTGDVCLVTKYSYRAGANDVEKMHEFEGAWDSAWDLA